MQIKPTKLVATFAAPAMLAMLLASSPVYGADRYAGLEACELAIPGGRLTASALCGSFEVPEDPDQPEGRRIELAYAVMPARSGRARPDPLVFLAGGPGDSARNNAPIMRAALRHINRDRDLIFLDQRGTGGSNPLHCRFDDMSDWMGMDLEPIDARLRECHDEWDADVRFYTTGHAAIDLDALRERYGFEQVNLLGGSYGTRMAQVYLRLYPERVRSMIIDGVVPTRLRLGSEHPIVLDQALGRLFDACQADEVCDQRFPELSDQLAGLIARYRESPEPLTLDDPRSGQPIEVLFSDNVLATALRFLSYSPQSQMTIPFLVHEAASEGRPDRLASQALMITEQLTDAIAVGLNFAVGCAEDWPSWPRDLDLDGTLLGSAMLDFFDMVCAWWPAGKAPEDFHQPFDPGLPVLILSGEFDPVTPPEYGDEAAAQYADSRHLVGTGLGHIVSIHPCFTRIITEFIDSLDSDGLDTECIEQLGPEPFFINLLGPAP